MNSQPPSLSREDANQNIENFLALRPLDYKFPDEEVALLRLMVTTLEMALKEDEDVVVCGLLSRILLYDTDGIRNYPRALELAKIAQKGGNLHGLHAMGNIHNNGLGLEKDPQRATACFNQAAERGFAPSQLSLGKMIAAKGRYREALQYLVPAAQQNYAPAQFVLGVMYWHGLGVDRNNTEAINLLDKASKQGWEEAQQALETVLQSIGAPLPPR